MRESASAIMSQSFGITFAITIAICLLILYIHDNINGGGDTA